MALRYVRDHSIARRPRPVVRAVGLHVDVAGREVLTGVDLVAHAGEVVAVVGANGSGKSTLLETLAGLVAPRYGTVDLSDPNVGYVAQQATVSELLPITVVELVAMGRWRRAGFWRPLSSADREIVEESLEAVGLAQLRRRPLAELSGGQRQRALLGQGLARRAPLMLLDEPMTALDVDSRIAIESAIIATSRLGTAIVVATHDLEELSRVDAVVALGA